MKNQTNTDGTAIVRVCDQPTIKHLQPVELVVTVSYGAKQFTVQLTIEEATKLATSILLEVCKRNYV